MELWLFCAVRQSGVHAFAAHTFRLSSRSVAEGLHVCWYIRQALLNGDSSGVRALRERVSFLV